MHPPDDPNLVLPSDHEDRALRIEQLDPALVPIYQRMTVPERLRASFAATRLVRERIRAHLRGSKPDWTPAQVEAELARRMLHGSR